MEENNIENYVDFEIAVQLKKVGFNWKTQYFYEVDDGYESRETNQIEEDFNSSHPDAYSCPTYSYVHKWLRDEKGICINVIGDDGGEFYWEKVYLPNYDDSSIAPETLFINYIDHMDEETKYFPSYENALKDAITQIIHLFINKEI